MTDEIQFVFGGQTAHIAVAGSGPVDVSISIYGSGGAVGYNPPDTVSLEYYDPVRGMSVRETVPIGGGYTASMVTVTTGSLIASETWMGEIRVTPLDNFDGTVVSSPVEGWGRSTPGWVRSILGIVNAVDDGVSGVYGVPGYSVGVLGSQVALNGGIQLNTTYPPGYLASLGINPNNLGSLYDAQYDAWGNFIGIDPRCFPAFTPIAISLTETRPISDIRVGDTVLAFDPAADLGRGALVPRKVVRLYRNTTEEWVKLTWAEGGEAKELVATPGHHFLDRFGNFPTIEDMLENGNATVVLASGELTDVTAERIVWSAETAHLFEQAQAVGMVAGNAALKPAAIDAWQTYNFEVADLHTYVAGGVRVHNSSGVLGQIGNSLDAQVDKALNFADGSIGDKITDALTAPLHIMNNGATAAAVAYDCAGVYVETDY